MALPRNRNTVILDIRITLFDYIRINIRVNWTPYFIPFSRNSSPIYLHNS